MGMWSLVVAVAAATVATVAKGQPALVAPAVTGVAVSNASLEEHHTDHFVIEHGFAIRRGQPFELVVETDGALDLASMGLTMVNDKPKEYNSAEFKVDKVTAAGANKYTVQVSTAVASPLGKYENLVFRVVVAGGHKAGAEFKYASPVYLLFNPWLPEDKLVYIPTEEMRREHVLSEYGNVFCGSTNSYATTKWYYGITDQVTLDAVFHLLERANRAQAHDVIHVVQTMSRNQGMMRKKDGSVLVGTEEALLEGNWGDFPFDDDNDPEIWTSTTDILNQWKATGKPTKYGQCWIFGALQNALMRTVGVGSRQLTAFGAWMDNSNRRDKHHKLHHVADEYYNLNGTAIFIESQAWNYHSWNDIWLNRNSSELSGWQSLDGTPPGNIGPAPVSAIHDLDEVHPFNVSDVISTVHSTSRSFLVSCNRDHHAGEKLKGCTVEKLLKYDHSGLPLLLTSRTVENGTLVEHEITRDFIDPESDAFIPFDDSDALPVAARRLRAAGEQGAERATAASMALRSNARLRSHEGALDAVRVVPSTYGVIVGSPVSGFIDIDTTPFKDGESLQVNMMFTLETRTGHQVKQLMAVSERVLVKAHRIEVPFSVDASAYLQRDLADVFVRIVVAGVSDETKQHFFAKAVLDIDAPPLYVRAPSTIEARPEGSSEPGREYPVVISFRSPLTFDLKKICLTLHSHQLDLAGHASNVTSINKCADLGPGESLEIEAAVLAPTKPGQYYVLASLSGEFLPLAQAHSLIEVTAAPTKGPQQELPVVDPRGPAADSDEAFARQGEPGPIAEIDFQGDFEALA